MENKNRAASLASHLRKINHIPQKWHPVGTRGRIEQKSVRIFIQNLAGPQNQIEEMPDFIQTEPPDCLHFFAVCHSQFLYIPPPPIMLKQHLRRHGLAMPRRRRLPDNQQACG